MMMMMMMMMNIIINIIICIKILDSFEDTKSKLNRDLVNFQAPKMWTSQLLRPCNSSDFSATQSLMEIWKKA